jgi:hypothetical protein
LAFQPQYTWPHFFGISFVACFILLNHGHHCQRMADEILL